MNVSNLKEFLYDLNLSGYASGEEREWIKEKDYSTTIPFVKGKFSSHDNFFGGEPYGGRIIVFYEEKPVWIMVYYGLITGKHDPDRVYKVLREALKHMPKDYPYRGPKALTIDDFTYHNTWKGEIDSYKGEETISYKGNIIYKASYLGGFVDRQEGV